MENPIWIRIDESGVPPISGNLHMMANEYTWYAKLTPSTDPFSCPRRHADNIVQYHWTSVVTEGKLDGWLFSTNFRSYMSLTSYPRKSKYVKINKQWRGWRENLQDLPRFQRAKLVSCTWWLIPLVGNFSLVIRGSTPFIPLKNTRVIIYLYSGMSH